MDSETIVAIFKTHSDAEQAIRDLQHGGFDMTKLSIVSKDYQTDEHVAGFYNTGDRMKYWGKFGAFWGGLWGLLFGAAFLFVPALGPVVVAGPLVASIGRTAGDYPIPVAIVPGHLSDEEIDALS